MATNANKNTLFLENIFKIFDSKDEFDKEIDNIYQKWCKKHNIPKGERTSDTMSDFLLNIYYLQKTRG